MKQKSSVDWKKYVGKNRIGQDFIRIQGEAGRKQEISTCKLSDKVVIRIIYICPQFI